MPWPMVARAAVMGLSMITGAGGGAYIGTQAAPDPAPREPAPAAYGPADEAYWPAGEEPVSRNGVPYGRGRRSYENDRLRDENDRLRDRLRALEGGDTCPPESIVRLPPRS